MYLRIICVGKLKEQWLLEAQNYYVSRISSFARIEVIELPDESAPKRPSGGQIQILLEKEGNRILRAAQGFDIVSVMTPEGREYSSESFASFLGQAEDFGKSLCLIIGGSWGVDEQIKKQAHVQIRMSKMTFPHRLARIVLLEQIFRGFKILRGQEYHK